MGFWDSIKNAAIKAKCGVGIHGGVFKTPDGKPECHLEKTCPDCNTIIEKKNTNIILNGMRPHSIFIVN